MLTALVLAVLARPQAVTFTHPCAHSSVVLEALGNEMGIKMAPGGSVLQDYFAVKFTDRDPETIKRLLAETLNAVWVQRGEYLVLDRGAKQHAEELQWENAILREQIEKFLEQSPRGEFDVAAYRKAVIDSLAARTQGDLYQRAAEEQRKKSPITYFSSAIVRAIGVDTLVAIRAGESLRYIWSNKGPSEMPLNLRQVVEKFVEDSRVASETSIAVGDDLSYEERYPGENDDNEIRIDVTRYLSNLSITYHQEANYEGGSSSVSRNLANFSIRATSPVRAKIDGLTGPFLLEDPARTLVKLASIKVIGSPLETRTISPEERRVGLAIGSDFANNEVLTIYGTKPLDASAEMAGFDYVALVPDGHTSYATWIRTAENAQLEQAWNAWCSGLEVKKDTETGVLLIKPLDTRNVRESRFDRVAASNFVKSFIQTNRMSLDSLGRLALATRDSRDFQNAYNEARLFLPISTYVNADYAALCIYGALSASQRRAASDQGAVLSLRNLPIKARNAIENSLKNTRYMYSSIRPNPPDWTTNGTSYSGEIHIKHQMLEALPQTTEVRVQVFSSKQLRPKTPANMYTSFPSAESIAMYQRMEPNRYSPDYTKLAVVDAERLQVEIFIPSQGYVTLSVQLDSGTDDTEYTTYDKLPEPWKSQIAEAIKKQGGG